MYRPVILIGNGARGNPALISHLCGLGIPVLTTWQGIDLVAEDNPAFCGRPGVFGQRAANIIQQKATHLYCVGARLDGEQVAYDYSRFAPGAIKAVYDCDRAELCKFPSEWFTVFANLSDNPPATTINPSGGAWLAWCKALYSRFRPELDGVPAANGYIDTFEFIHKLGEVTDAQDLLAIGSSSGAVNAFLQAYKVKAGQRVTVCASIGAMGADIPMALGGCLASGRRTICVTGDGGFQLNAQELETIRRLNLPITFFVFSNGGYNSIRVMQDARYQGRHVGCNAESGYTMPDLRKLAHGYGINYIRLMPQWLHNLGAFINDRPQIVEVPVDPNWVQLPRVMASTVDGVLRTDDMQNMTPKLPAEELAEIMRWGG